MTSGEVDVITTSSATTEMAQRCLGEASHFVEGSSETDVTPACPLDIVAAALVRPEVCVFLVQPLAMHNTQGERLLVSHGLIGLEQGVVDAAKSQIVHDFEGRALALVAKGGFLACFADGSLLFPVIQ